MKILLPFIILLALVSGCVVEERPSYEPINNTLPPGGLKVRYDTSDSNLTNIAQVVQTLSPENRTIFQASLNWYATESTQSLKRLDDRTAHQVVNVVNCLKVTIEPEQQERCFDNL